MRDAAPDICLPSPVARAHDHVVTLLKFADQPLYIGRIMLTIRIHGQRVAETQRPRFLQTVQDRGPFALVGVLHQDAQAGVRRGQPLQRLGGPVGAAIDHDPDGLPIPARLADGLQNLRAGVEAGDQDQMRRRRQGK